MSIFNDQFDYHLLHHKAGWITIEGDDSSNDYLNQPFDKNQMCWDIPNIALWSIADAELPSGQIIICPRWTKLITMHITNTYANIILYTIACENLHILLIMKPGNFHWLTIWKHALTRIIPVKPHGNWHNLPFDNVLCVTLFAVIINIDLLFFIFTMVDIIHHHIVYFWNTKD